MNETFWSQLGMGGWQLNQGSEASAIQLLQEAYRLGITVYDTAPNYGLGQSETILGKAFKSMRNSVIFVSKFGHAADDKVDFSVGNLEASVKGSLARLQTSYLDALLLHNPPKEILHNQWSHYEKLTELKQRKVIREFGVSIDTLQEFETALAFPQITVVEILFNVFFQSPRLAFDRAKQKGVKIIVKVPLDSGWLTGKYTPSTSFTDVKKRWTPDVLERRSTLVQELQGMVRDPIFTKYAMAFIRCYPAVTSVIPGIRTQQQLIDHVTQQTYRLPRPYQILFERLYDQKIAPFPLPW